MDKTLYEYASDVIELLDQIDPETGELPEKLGVVMDLVKEKADACAAFVLANDSECTMLEERIKGAMDKLNAKRKKSAYIRSYLAQSLKRCGIHKIESDDGLVSIKLYIDRDKSAFITDESLIPDEYKMTYSSPKKLEIRNALMDGKEIPGALLISKDRLVIK
jgi:hypothetical protein